MRAHVLAASGAALLLLATACAGPLPGVACTSVGPPFGLTFDMTALNGPPQPADSPIVADYCADDACQGTYVRLFSADPAVTGGGDMRSAFIFDPDMTATPTAHLRLHDEGGPVTRAASTAVAARAVSSDVNGPGCIAEGHWGAVRVEPDGSLTDVTATTPLPESLQPR
ncbi:hypothetical protein CLV92_106161 [Kineococcus xinjiangensis]|uniref:LppP/LprE lipoprotein n=1 Tax=Kineococcus xinjiangensis TaxID=512762 RepID=A0A2S6IMH4_9ACTN|nr:hypothetical protein [Kineococcus xinjiangensis]PPK95340.1 hypothetical protein CLV92_106161 [Kineococcus xinjiangensis]